MTFNFTLISGFNNKAFDSSFREPVFIWWDWKRQTKIPLATVIKSSSCLPWQFDDSLKFIFSLLSVSGPQHNKTVVCYISTWAVYRPGRGSFNIDNFDPNLCTIAIYAFAGLDHINDAIKSLGKLCLISSLIRFRFGVTSMIVNYFGNSFRKLITKMCKMRGWR